MMIVGKVRKALQLARELLKGAEQREPPIDLRELANALGVRSIQPRPLMIDGYLGVSNEGELLIRYNEANTHVRNRFTVAHELGHILLAQAEGKAIKGRVSRNITRNSEEERAANVIAAELLMPDEVIAPVLRQQRSDWGTIFSLASHFAVSQEALIARILDLKSTAAVFFKINVGVHSEPTFVCKATQGIDFAFARPPRVAIVQDFRIPAGAG